MFCSHRASERRASVSRCSQRQSSLEPTQVTRPLAPLPPTPGPSSLSGILTDGNALASPTRCSHERSLGMRGGRTLNRFSFTVREAMLSLRNLIFFFFITLLISVATLKRPRLGCSSWKIVHGAHLACCRPDPCSGGMRVGGAWGEETGEISLQRT